MQLHQGIIKKMDFLMPGADHCVGAPARQRLHFHVQVCPQPQSFSAHIPEEIRSTVINCFRIPLNFFVCVILYNVSLQQQPVQTLMLQGRRSRPFASQAQHQLRACQAATPFRTSNHPACTQRCAGGELLLVHHVWDVRLLPGHLLRLPAPVCRSHPPGTGEWLLGNETRKLVPCWRGTLLAMHGGWPARGKVCPHHAFPAPRPPLPPPAGRLPL